MTKSGIGAMTARHFKVAIDDPAHVTSSLIVAAHFGFTRARSIAWAKERYGFQLDDGPVRNQNWNVAELLENSTLKLNVKFVMRIPLFC